MEGKGLNPLIRARVLFELLVACNHLHVLYYLTSERMRVIRHCWDFEVNEDEPSASQWSSCQPRQRSPGGRLESVARLGIPANYRAMILLYEFIQRGYNGRVEATEKFNLPTASFGEAFWLTIIHLVGLGATGVAVSNLGSDF